MPILLISYCPLSNIGRVYDILSESITNSLITNWLYLHQKKP